MAFTTWTDLKNKMLDDLESGNWRVQSYKVGRRERAYTSLEEFLSALKYVEHRAALETGSVVKRTYAAQGGRV